MEMNLLRHDTDYALPAMVNLAKHCKQGPTSMREMAYEKDISYQLVCKIQ